MSCYLIQETRTSDIHCLDLETWTWSEMYVTLFDFDKKLLHGSQQIIDI